MCGFVAIVAAAGKPVEGAVLRRMTDMLTHRGPDAGGYACVDPATGICREWRGELANDERLSGVMFGHRRLSIIDRTAAGHQPMFSDDRSRVLCFNGEIYNFIELRSELRSAGVTFRGGGDTEVLLRAYERWGEDAFQRLNGMWALVLWDGLTRTLVVSRDRFGIKPLYYTSVDGAWLFASEIKALLPFPGAFRGFDDENVLDFVGRSLVDHHEATLFRGIRQVAPASVVVCQGDGARQRPFWTLRLDPSLGRLPEADLVERYGGLLADAVHLRMRSDVPVGSVMSGGIDSTSVTALAVERLKGAATPDEALGFAVFSACWPGWEQDEEPAIDQVCRALGLVSHKVYPTAEMVGDLLPTVAYYLEEPFENPTAVVQHLLMNAARAQGVTVLLTGHGSDEVLAGYPDRFVPPFLTDLLLAGRPVEFLRARRAFKGGAEGADRLVAEALLYSVLPSALRWRLKGVLQSKERRRRRSGVIPASAHSSERGPCPGAPIGPAPSGPVSWHFPPNGLSTLNRSLWSRVTQTLLPTWLRMEDRMGMACSVEARAPFMDHRLIEFAFSMPDDMKLRNGYTKYVLRQAMRDRLPRSTTLSRVKRKFATPYDEWLRGPWRPMVEDLLLSGSPRLESYVDSRHFRPKARSFLDGARGALDGKVLWRTLATEIFLRTFTEAALQPRRS